MTPICQPASESLAEARPVAFSVRGQILLAACGCSGASAFLFAVDPSQHAVYPQCWLYNATGIYCAGCGATRAIHALLHGRVLSALHDNALFVSALPLLLFIGGSYVLAAWQKNAWPRNEVDPPKLLQWALGSMIVMLAFMAVRNLPGMPFDLLKPLTN